MRKLALLIVCFFAIAPSMNLSASSQQFLKIGNFDIDALCHHGGFLLDDGNVYKPVSDNQKRSTLDWQKGDAILVLKAHRKNRFLLVNTRTGEKSKMKVASPESCT